MTADTPDMQTRIAGLRALGVGGLLLGVFSLLGGLLGIALLDQDPSAFVLAGVVVAVGAGTAMLVAGVGFLLHRPWCRPLGFAAGALALLHIPLGTVYGIVVFIVLTRPGLQEALQE